MMGAESVDYHRATVLARADGYPGAALGYYGSRGETPLVWGGSGADAFRPRRRRDRRRLRGGLRAGRGVASASGVRLVETRRPGMELVIGAHKSLAVLGVIGRADDMHAIWTPIATPPLPTSTM